MIQDMVYSSEFPWGSKEYSLFFVEWCILYMSIASIVCVVQFHYSYNFISF